MSYTSLAKKVLRQKPDYELTTEQTYHLVRQICLDKIRNGSMGEFNEGINDICRLLDEAYLTE